MACSLKGAWSWLEPRFRRLLALDLEYAGRAELCQPAVGVGKVHQQEAAAIITQTFS